jgi:hypothetical protein
LFGVGDGPDDPVGGVRDEVLPVNAHCFHGDDPVSRLVNTTAA